MTWYASRLCGPLRDFWSAKFNDALPAAAALVQGAKADHFTELAS